MSSDLGSKVVIVNFKAYAEVDGPKAADLAAACEEIAKESGAQIIVCPPMVETAFVASAVGIPVFSQNVDPKKPGSATGWVTPSMVKACGCRGTLINHAEHKVDAEAVGQAVQMAKELGLVTVVCANTVEDAKILAKFAPDYIAVEPPELIGGENVSATPSHLPARPFGHGSFALAYSSTHTTPSPCKSPHTTNVSFAPCHRPESRNTQSVAAICRKRPFCEPPSGI